MAGLYVPLDVELASDDKMIAAGPMAELLYIRALAFAKRTMSDGHIRRNQLPLVAARIPRHRLHVQRLVELGAWKVTDDGWYIVAWRKWNRAMAELAAAKSEAGVAGNHRRWHAGKGGRPSPDCPLCIANGIAPAIAEESQPIAKGREGKKT